MFCHQLSRLLQLQAYYAYEDYYEHTLRDESVLTIRDPKVQPHTPVLDTGATCSDSNNPVEILEILPSNMLLKPAVGPPQSMREVYMTVPTFDITGDPLHFEVSDQAVVLHSIFDYLLMILRITSTSTFFLDTVTPSSRLIHMIYDNFHA
jgi:hypothetical protein